MNVRIKYSENSFTLTEILVYIAVFSIIILTLFSFTFWLIHSAAKARVMRETLDNARRAMEIIVQETREAKSIYIPTTTLNQLSLKTAHHLPDGEEVTYIDFYLCGKQLCLKRESQPPVALTSDKVEVSILEFNQVATTADISSVQIFLKVDYENPTSRPEYQSSVSLISTVSLR